MICAKCGGNLENIITDLPFKIEKGSIIIIKNIPVLQCKNCNDYLIKDPIMEKIDLILSKIDKTAELEILNYAA